MKGLRGYEYLYSLFVLTSIQDFFCKNNAFAVILLHPLCIPLTS